MNDWHIQSRAHACQSCGEAFRDQVGYHTLLFDEKREMTRMDICSGCYTKQFAEARDRHGFISHWQGVYEAPPAVAPDAIRKDTAEDLLRKLVELNDPRYLAASYILAVMLERKRLLRVKEQLRQGNTRTFIYEHPKSGDIFTIPDPALQLDQLEAVQRLVGDLLEHGIAPEGVVAPGSPPAATREASGSIVAADSSDGVPSSQPQPETVSGAWSSQGESGDAVAGAGLQLHSHPFAGLAARPVIPRQWVRPQGGPKRNRRHPRRLMPTDPTRPPHPKPDDAPPTPDR